MIRPGDRTVSYSRLFIPARSSQFWRPQLERKALTVPEFNGGYTNFRFPRVRKRSYGTIRELDERAREGISESVHELFEITLTQHRSHLRVYISPFNVIQEPPFSSYGWEESAAHVHASRPKRAEFVWYNIHIVVDMSRMAM